MSTGSRKSTKRSGAKKGTASRGKKSNQFNPIYDEVAALIVIVISILLFCSCIGIAGKLGNAVGAVMFGLFGVMSFVFPIVLTFSVAFYLSNKGKTVAKVKVWSAIVFLVVLCSVAHLVWKTDAQTIKEYYSACSELKKGGGIVGGVVAGNLVKVIGKFGTWVVMIALAIITFILITERSFFGSVKRGGTKLYESAKNDAQMRREYYEELERKREQERALKEENEPEPKVRRSEKHKRGITSDITLTSNKPVIPDIEEVKIEGEIDPREFENIIVRTQHQINLDDVPLEPVHITPDLFEPDVEELPQETTPKTKHMRTGIRKAAMESEMKEAKAPMIPDDVTVTSAFHESTKPKPVASLDAKKESSEMKKYQGVYEFPPIDLLKKGKVNENMETPQQLKETAAKLVQTLSNFGVHVTMTDISQGPTVTRYEMQPEQGTKVSKILNLTDDIKLNMAATDIRIEAPIPGKAAIGIEIPNKENSTVMFRDLIESKEFAASKSNISFAVGKDIGGQTVVTDIAKMPHLLIAGATGSGKSVCINTLIMSILYKAHPDDVKMIMVDPKVVELSVYNGIPHLLIPVVTEPKKATAALQWGVNEMTDRYNKFAEYGVRDIKGYNKKIESFTDIPEEERPKKLPQIVIIVDELADLMMVAPGDVEESICRLAQLARAAGIHLIIATQRPSVDVITGLIKANMPSRIAFSVSSGVDSRTILDTVGAEKLLGKGDMLFYPQGYTKPARIQGAYVSDDEVSDVVDFLKEHSEGSSYQSDIELKMEQSQSQSGGMAASDKDQYFIEAAKFIIDKDKASIGMLQRVFKIGFNRAARIMDQLAEAGVVGEEEGTKPRKVLMSMEQFEQYIEEEY